MFKKIALGLVAVIVAAALVIVALAASKPDTFVCERAREMNAPREAVLPLVADFRNWPSWSPWREYDPNQTITYGATTSGVGGTYAWRGNDQVGRGEMEIESVTERGEQTTFTHRLEFFEPFASRASTRFVVEPAGAGRTKVTWTMTSTPGLHGEDPRRAHGTWTPRSARTSTEASGAWSARPAGVPTPTPRPLRPA
jgi:hypothetical protein